MWPEVKGQKYGMDFTPFQWSGKCKTLRVLLAAILGYELEDYDRLYPQYKTNYVA